MCGREGSPDNHKTRPPFSRKEGVKTVRDLPHATCGRGDVESQVQLGGGDLPRGRWSRASERPLVTATAAADVLTAPRHTMTLPGSAASINLHRPLAVDGHSLFVSVQEAYYYCC